MPDTLTHAGLGTLTSAVRRRLKHVVGARLVSYNLTIQQFWVMLVLLEQGPTSLHPSVVRARDHGQGPKAQGPVAQVPESALWPRCER